MKYFTRELWLGFNTEDEGAFRANDQAWRHNVAAYRQQLAGLEPRLNKQTYQFFTTVELHDGRLLSFDVNDNPNYKADGLKPYDRNARNVAVTINVLTYEQDLIYSLRYGKVKRTIFDYPTSDPLFEEEENHIGDWGYHELTEIDESYLRHEVMFSSGTSILIEFKHFSHKKQRIRKESIFKGGNV